MMIQTTIKCPNCRKEVGQLEFWHGVDGIHFHICSKCIHDIGKNGIIIKDSLLIGYWHGYEQAKQDVKKKVEEL